MMRTISILGIVLGFFVAGVSTWRWMVFYDEPFRLVMGLFVAVSIMAWAYMIDWRTDKDKYDEKIERRIDSLRQELAATKELNNLK